MSIRLCCRLQLACPWYPFQEPFPLSSHYLTTPIEDWSSSQLISSGATVFIILCCILPLCCSATDRRRAGYIPVGNNRGTVVYVQPEQQRSSTITNVMCMACCFECCHWDLPEGTDCCDICCGLLCFELCCGGWHGAIKKACLCCVLENEMQNMDFTTSQWKKDTYVKCFAMRS